VEVIPLFRFPQALSIGFHTLTAKWPVPLVAQWKFSATPALRGFFP
jgi:hypothetical protein